MEFAEVEAQSIGGVDEYVLWFQSEPPGRGLRVGEGPGAAGRTPGVAPPTVAIVRAAGTNADGRMSHAAGTNADGCASHADGRL